MSAYDPKRTFSASLDHLDRHLAFEDKMFDLVRLVSDPKRHEQFTSRNGNSRLSAISFAQLNSLNVFDPEAAR
jgi:hypothetical protein